MAVRLLMLLMQVCSSQDLRTQRPLPFGGDQFFNYSGLTFTGNVAQALQLLGDLG